MTVALSMVALVLVTELFGSAMLAFAEFSTATLYFVAPVALVQVITRLPLDVDAFTPVGATGGVVVELLPESIPEQLASLAAVLAVRI